MISIFTTEKEIDSDDSDDDEDDENIRNLCSVSMSKLRLKFLDMLMLNRPQVFIFASCWSYYSEINQILQSIGIFSALRVSKERGDLTMEKLFGLNDEQKDFLKFVANNDKKDIIVAGMY